VALPTALEQLEAMLEDLLRRQSATLPGRVPKRGNALSCVKKRAVPGGLQLNSVPNSPCFNMHGDIPPDRGGVLLLQSMKPMSEKIIQTTVEGQCWQSWSWRQWACVRNKKRKNPAPSFEITLADVIATYHEQRGRCALSVSVTPFTSIRWRAFVLDSRDD
jgi:hypothetical protein